MRLDLGPEGDATYVSFFGTGFRSQSSVSLESGGLPVPVPGAVAQGQFEGLDQLVVGPLPRALAGRRAVNVLFTVDGKRANPVTLGFLWALRFPWTSYSANSAEGAFGENRRPYQACSNPNAAP